MQLVYLHHRMKHNFWRDHRNLVTLKGCDTIKQAARKPNNATGGHQVNFVIIVRSSWPGHYVRISSSTSCYKITLISSIGLITQPHCNHTCLVGALWFSWQTILDVISYSLNNNQPNLHLWVACVTRIGTSWLRTSGQGEKVCVPLFQPETSHIHHWLLFLQSWRTIDDSRPIP